MAAYFRSKSTPPTTAKHTVQSQSSRQQHAGDQAAKAFHNGKDEAAKVGQALHTSTFAALLEGPLLMPATASMFVDYPVRSPSLIHRLNKPLPALPKDDSESIYELGTEEGIEEENHEEVIAELYHAYRPILRTPSILPSQRRGNSKPAEQPTRPTNESGRGFQRNVRRIPSWRPSVLRKKKAIRGRDGQQTASTQVRHRHPEPRQGIDQQRRAQVLNQAQNSAPIRPSPLRQSLNIADRSSDGVVPAASAGLASAPMQPLLLNPTAPMSNPPARRQPNCWTSLKKSVRKCFMDEDSFDEWQVEGWQMHDGFKQINPNYRTSSPGADRFGKMEFMVWSTKNK